MLLTGDCCQSFFLPAVDRVCRLMVARRWLLAAEVWLVVGDRWFMGDCCLLPCVRNKTDACSGGALRDSDHAAPGISS